MRIEDLGELGQALDAAANGLLTALAARCERRGLELHIYVLTHLEGLPKGRMKLCIHAVGPDGTETLQSCDLGPAQRELGWNLYLKECTSKVRQAIRNAKGCLKVAEALAAEESCDSAEMSRR